MLIYFSSNNFGGTARGFLLHYTTAYRPDTTGIITLINVALKGLSETIVVFNPFYQPFKSLLLGTKCVFEHQDLQMFGLILNKYK